MQLGCAKRPLSKTRCLCTDLRPVACTCTARHPPAAPHGAGGGLLCMAGHQAADRPINAPRPLCPSGTRHPPDR